jgi:hypothetical protein
MHGPEALLAAFVILFVPERDSVICVKASSFASHCLITRLTYHSSRHSFSASYLTTQNLFRTDTPDKPDNDRSTFPNLTSHFSRPLRSDAILLAFLFDSIAAIVASSGYPQLQLQRHRIATGKMGSGRARRPSDGALGPGCGTRYAQLHIYAGYLQTVEEEL